MKVDILSQNTWSKVSIIIPVYNTEKHLRQCIDSVVNQTYPNLEIICIDDESIDSSGQILKEYALRDQRVRLLSQPKSGQGAARNLGINEASGDYIIFLDSDDWCAATLCEKLLHVIEEKPVDFVICAAKLYDEQRQKYSAKSSYHSLDIFASSQKIRKLEDVGSKIFEIPVMSWGKIFRTDFLKKNKIRFFHGHAFEDNGFFIDIFLAMKGFTILKEPLVFYRINRENSDTLSTGAKYLDCIFQLSYQKEALEKACVYLKYEEIYIGHLFYTLEIRQEQIHGDYKEIFYQEARRLVLSLSISKHLWEKSVCIRENYLLYKNYSSYDAWMENRRQGISFSLKKQIKAKKIIYYFCGIPICKSYIDGEIKIIGIHLGKLTQRKEIQI